MQSGGSGGEIETTKIESKGNAAFTFLFLFSFFLFLSKRGPLQVLERPLFLERRKKTRSMVSSSSSSSYPRPRRVGVGAAAKAASSQQLLSLRDVEREVEDVFETHSVAEIREVRHEKRAIDFDRSVFLPSLFRPFSPLTSSSSSPPVFNPFAGDFSMSFTRLRGGKRDGNISRAR